MPHTNINVLCSCILFCIIIPIFHDFDANNKGGTTLVYYEMKRTNKIRQFRFFQCLNKTTYEPSKPNAFLHPTQPIPYLEWESHALDLINATKDFRNLPYHSFANWHGPWMENYFISNFFSENVKVMKTYLFNFWYPILPIFAQWTEICCSMSKDVNIDREKVSFFWRTKIRKDVIYFTVTQHDMGAPGDRLLIPELYQNTVILSGGGWGTIPAPLIAGRLYPLDLNLRTRRRFVMSFVGSYHTGREILPSILKSSTLPQSRWILTEGDYKTISFDSVFALTPRGLGRASFRTYEMIQLGVIPIYINFKFGNEAGVWVPYKSKGLWDDPISAGGFTTSYEHLSTFICGACRLFEHGSGMSATALRDSNPWKKSSFCYCSEAMWNTILNMNSTFIINPTSAIATIERRLPTLTEEFYTYDALVTHIESFIMLEEESAFQCESKPHSWGTFHGEVIPLG